MNLNMLTLLLLAGAVNGPSEPEPEPPPKKPANPEREAALLSPPHVLPDEPTTWQLDTAIRIARQQARDIDAYLRDHSAERAEELRRHRLSLLDFADNLADDPRSLLRMRCGNSMGKTFPGASTPTPIDLNFDTAVQTRAEVPVWTPAPRAHPGHNRPPMPRPPKVRCPVKHCQAGPGKLCRGRSGEAMDTIHPERQRALDRREK